MADLSMDDALRLAGSLMTIGHPYQQAAINATAWDLIQLCKGCFQDGRPVSPQQQAERLVNAARDWEEGWPEKGGTRRLRELFRELFGAREPDFVPVAAAELVQRGLLARPCEHCEPDAPYCEYGGARRHAREKSMHEEYSRAFTKAIAAAEEAHKPKPVANFKPLTPEEMEKALEDERRRKKEQLKKLDDDQSS